MACEAREGVHWVRVEKQGKAWRIETSKRCKKLLTLKEKAEELVRTKHPSEVQKEDFTLPTRDREKWEARLKILLTALHACKEE